MVFLKRVRSWTVSQTWLRGCVSGGVQEGKRAHLSSRAGKYLFVASPRYSKWVIFLSPQNCLALVRNRCLAVDESCLRGQIFISRHVAPSFAHDMKYGALGVFESNLGSTYSGELGAVCFSSFMQYSLLFPLSRSSRPWRRMLPGSDWHFSPSVQPLIHREVHYLRVWNTFSPIATAWAPL